MNQPLLSFTPSALPSETLEELFVAREGLLRRLETNVDHLMAGAVHHTLIVGPRGIGKTHLTSLLYHRVKARKEVAVAWLREDPWGLRSYEQLVDQLADAVRREDGQPAAGRHTDRSSAEASLAAAVGDRHLLVLIENFVDVLGRIKLEGQQALRALLQNSGRILVVATSPSLGGDVTKQAAPFYGFFETVRLEELTLEEASELLTKVAALRGDHALVAFLSTETAQRRLKVVEALAGGHPRVWMLLANCMSIETIDELVPVFLKALDDLTPYYQDRMRELPPQQESIVFELCEHRLPLTVGVIALRCGLHQNAASVQIRELVDKGYLRKFQTTGGDRRKAYYELREPLMRICLDVKESRGEPLRLIVEFLRDWYGLELFDLRLRLADTLPLAQRHVDAAIDALLKSIVDSQDLALIRALAVAGHRQRLEQIVVQASSGSPAGLFAALFFLGRFTELAEVARTADFGENMEMAMELLHRGVSEMQSVLRAEGQEAAVVLWTRMLSNFDVAAVLLQQLAGQFPVQLGQLTSMLVVLFCLASTDEEQERFGGFLANLAIAEPKLQSQSAVMNAVRLFGTDQDAALRAVPAELRPILTARQSMLDAPPFVEARQRMQALSESNNSEGGEGDLGVPEGDTAAPVGEGVVGQ